MGRVEESAMKYRLKFALTVTVLCLFIGAAMVPRFAIAQVPAHGSGPAECNHGIVGPVAIRNGSRRCWRKRAMVQSRSNGPHQSSRHPAIARLRRRDWHRHALGCRAAQGFALVSAAAVQGLYSIGQRQNSIPFATTKTLLGRGLVPARRRYSPSLAR